MTLRLPNARLQISELEQAADELVALESRAEMAEAEAEAAAESMAVMTPRPPRPAPAAEQLLGPEGLAALQAAALQYRYTDCASKCCSVISMQARSGLRLSRAANGVKRFTQRFKQLQQK
jgi:hypothetical protein